MNSSISGRTLIFALFVMIGAEAHGLPECDIRFNPPEIEGSPDTRHRCDDPIPRPPPPPPPPPPVPLDDMYTQIGYRYTVRSGDWNGDGYPDLYIKRLDGDPDNGVVYEAMARQDANGYFTVLPTSSSNLTIGRQWPVLDVTVRGGDSAGDGHSDPTIVDLPDVPGFRYGQTFVSSGEDYQRNAVHVAAFDEAAQMFTRDLVASAGNPDYWDDAKEPDESGYRIDLVIEWQICQRIWGFLYCWYDARVYNLGTIRLGGLGSALSAFGISPASSAAGTSADGNSIKLADNFETTSAAPAAVIAMNNNAHAVVNDPQISTFLGTPSERDTSMNYFGLAANVVDDVLYCVWLCGWSFYSDYYGFTFVRWYDVWTPVTIEGAFDDVNYSRDAFEFVEGEWDLDEILRQGGQAQAGAARESLRRMIEAIFRVGGDTRPIDTDGPYIETEILTDAARAAVKAAQRIKHWWLCRNTEDPQECITNIEEDMLGDTTEEQVAAEGVTGIWFPDDMDEDDRNFAENFPLLAAIVIEASKPGRWQCSYRKRHRQKDLTYYGITSTHAGDDCDSAVERRSRRHDASWRFQQEGSWWPSDLDKETNIGGTVLGTQLVARRIIRGREQQLIDEVLFQKPWKNYEQGRGAPEVFNLIRSVSQWNILGCAYWKGSNLAFPWDSPIGPFTGFDNLSGAPVTGCSQE